jgi:hypothetical protein
MRGPIDKQFRYEGVNDFWVKLLLAFMPANRCTFFVYCPLGLIPEETPTIAADAAYQMAFVIYRSK